MARAMVMRFACPTSLARSPMARIRKKSSSATASRASRTYPRRRPNASTPKSAASSTRATTAPSDLERSQGRSGEAGAGLLEFETLSGDEIIGLLKGIQPVRKPYEETQPEPQRGPGPACRRPAVRAARHHRSGASTGALTENSARRRTWTYRAVNVACRRFRRVACRGRGACPIRFLFGLYRGVVVNSTDRCKPDGYWSRFTRLGADAGVGDAMRSLRHELAERRAAPFGTDVWIEYEQGDASRPVWVGWRGGPYRPWPSARRFDAHSSAKLRMPAANPRSQ